jgi:hypothetical protein
MDPPDAARRSMTPDTTPPGGGDDTTLTVRCPVLHSAASRDQAFAW